MGNVLVGRAQATIQDLRTYLLELHPQQRTPLVFHAMIGSGKFLKSLQCKCETGGAVVVKVYLPQDPDQDLKPHEEVLLAMARALELSKQPNLLPYQEWQQSPKAPNPAFLVRQYLFSSLEDRLAQRPFLAPVEKRWLAFQLLKALQQLHAAGFCHGDVKSENVMVTSWNWLILTDMAPFKPTYIPEDDPADYAFFFGGSQGGGSKTGGKLGQQQLEGRKCCCVAPERFFSERRGGDASASTLPGMAGMAIVPDSTLALEDEEDDAENAAAAGAAAPAQRVRGLRPQGALRPAMDIFSAGCVIAELLGGDRTAVVAEPLFDLPALLRYRRGEHARVDEVVAGIGRSQGNSSMATANTSSSRGTGESDRVSDRSRAARALVKHMVNLDASKRNSAASYLQLFTETPAASHSGASQRHVRGDAAAASALTDHVAGDGDVPFLFPAFFATFLFDFMRQMLGLDADERISAVAAAYAELLHALANGARDDHGASLLRRAIANSLPSAVDTEQRATGSDDAAVDDKIGASNSSKSADTVAKAGNAQARAHELVVETQKLIEEMNALESKAESKAESKTPSSKQYIAEHDSTIDKENDMQNEPMSDGPDLQVSTVPPSFAYMLPPPGALAKAAAAPAHKRTAAVMTAAAAASAAASPNMGGGLRSAHKEDPFARELLSGIEGQDVGGDGAADGDNDSDVDNGLVIVLSLICTSIRHVRQVQTKVVAVALLVRLGAFADDEVWLQRLVPVLVTLLDDEAAAVRAAAVRGLATLLAMVRRLPPVDHAIFPGFVFPALARFPADSDDAARAAFAEVLPSLAESSRRFLELAHAAKTQQLLSELRSGGRRIGGGGGGSSRSTEDAAAAATQGIDPALAQAREAALSAASAAKAKKTGVSLDDDDESKTVIDGEAHGGKDASDLSQQKAASLSTERRRRKGQASDETDAEMLLLSANFDDELGKLQQVVARLVVQVLMGQGGAEAMGMGASTPMMTSMYAGTSGGASGSEKDESLAKRSLLRDIERLCLFFGREFTLDVVLPQLITFLNDRDPALQADFFDAVAAICGFVGSRAVGEIVIPCIETKLYDDDEIVIARAVACFGSLIRAKLCDEAALLAAAESTAPLALHPSLRVRDAAISTLSAVAAQFSPPDDLAFVLPLLDNFVQPGWADAMLLTGLGADIESPHKNNSVLTRAALESGLLEPLPRAAFERRLAERAGIVIGGGASDGDTIADDIDYGNTSDVLREESFTASPSPSDAAASAAAAAAAAAAAGASAPQDDEMADLMDAMGVDIQEVTATANAAATAAAKYAAAAAAEAQASLDVTSASPPRRNSIRRHANADIERRLGLIDEYISRVATTLRSNNTKLAALRSNISLSSNLNGSTRAQAQAAAADTDADAALLLPKTSQPPEVTAYAKRLQRTAQHTVAVPNQHFIHAFRFAKQSSHGHSQNGDIHLSSELKTKVSSEVTTHVSQVDEVSSTISLMTSKDGSTRSIVPQSLDKYTSPAAVVSAYGVLPVSHTQGPNAGRAKAAAVAAAAVGDDDDVLQRPNSLMNLDYAHDAKRESSQDLRGAMAGAAGAAAALAAASAGTQRIGGARNASTHLATPALLSTSTAPSLQRINPVAAAAAALHARLRALQVPPLAPDMGRLRHRDGQAFTVYSTKAGRMLGPQVDGESETRSGGDFDDRQGGGRPSGNPGTGAVGVSSADSHGGSRVGATPTKHVQFGTLPRRRAVLRQDAGAESGCGAPAPPVFIAGSTYDNWWPSWRPQEGGMLLAELKSHRGAVNKLAVSQDHTYFASASDDGQVKIWESRRLQRDVSLRPRLSYPSADGQTLGRITDLCCCDNSHSLAAASSKGEVSVFKVEYGRLRSAMQDSTSVGMSPMQSRRMVRIMDTTFVRSVRAQGEGGVVLVRHFTAQAQSMLVFVTQAGIVHGWDLRARREVWCCIVPPDLGYPTAIELGPDNCWFVVGTHRGFLCVWDTRFQIMVKCFQHSSACPIRALRFCPPRQRWMQVGRVAWEVPTVYVAVGNNEVTTWDLETGQLRQCFRTVTPRHRESDVERPTLIEQKLPPLCRSAAAAASRVGAGILQPAQQDAYLRELNVHARAQEAQDALSVRCLLTPPALQVMAGGTSAPFLVTAGADRRIRYWDLHHPGTIGGGQGSFMISGLETGQPRPTFYEPRTESGTPIVPDCDMYVCQDPNIADAVISGTPEAEHRGPVPPTSNNDDCVLDLQVLNSGNRPLLLSAGRNGVVKVWR